MSRVLKVFIFVVFAFYFVTANNLKVSNVSILSENSANHTRFIKFDISWDHSWRDNINWDAAWLFIKYKVGCNEWKHATLSSVAWDHYQPDGSTITPRADGKGFFLYRSSYGTGTINLSGVRLLWNYRADAVLEGSEIKVKVFGVEMVNIPLGSFYAGDGEEINYSYNLGTFRSGSSDKTPWHITSESAINVSNISSGGYYYANSRDGNRVEDATGSTFTIPESFPKGYKAIYCMKYEITQGQYMDFLNTLTRTQQKTRVGSNISGDTIINIYVMSNTSAVNYRNVITCPSYGNGTENPIVFCCERPDRACNLISWSDGCAYSDWSGLRPMTELEYEKICRGPVYPVVEEYAWGSKNITRSTTINGIEDGTETVNNGANCNYYYNINLLNGGDGGYGPLRVGIFAKSNTTREQSGSTYYGVMEMSGNLWERSVTVGNSSGRTFSGINGDGVLDNTGIANVTGWPGTNAEGAGHCGCGWDYSWVGLRVSSRISAAAQDHSRFRSFGFRCVIFAP